MNILAHLIGKFARSPEDAATEGLVKLLCDSSSARSAVNRLLAAWGVTVEVDRWESQVTTNDGARTDAQGYSNGKLVVIMENKFWAGLTDNQPITYLDRLSTDGALLFVAPERRRHILQVELAKRCLEPVTFGESDSALLTSGKRLVVTSWDVILQAIEIELLTVPPESAQLLDCRQLIGLAQYFGSWTGPKKVDGGFSAASLQLTKFYGTTIKV